MRNPDRIPLILDMLKLLWERNPDQRLGQLIINVSRFNGWPEDNLFNLEDGKLTEFLAKDILKDSNI